MYVLKDQQLNEERKIFLVIKLSFLFIVSHRTSAGDGKLLKYNRDFLSPFMNIENTEGSSRAICS